MKKDICETLEKCREKLNKEKVLRNNEKMFAVFGIEAYKNTSQETLKEVYRRDLDIYFTDIKRKKTYKLNEQGLLDEVKEDD